MATIGTLMTDGQYAPRFERTAEGEVGTRTYRVNTHDELRAMDAQGVPQIGDAWDATRPDLRATRVSPAYQFGTDDPASQTGGTTYVEVEYRVAADRGGGAGPRPEPNLRYTEFDDEVSGETVYFGLDAETEPVNNGNGATIEVGTLVARVTVWFAANALTQGLFETLKNLRRRVNSNPVLLPPMLNCDWRPQFQPGELRYRTFSHQPQGRLVRVVHHLVIADRIEIEGSFYSGHRVQWRVENADGTRGTVRTVRVYPEAEFPAEIF